MKFIYFSFFIIFDLTLSSTTTLSDLNVDTQTLAQPVIEENWEELLVAGPIVVNYISNLMILNSKRDFSLKSSSPNHVYQYIKYPNSFRNTLAQIANEIYAVFIRAHSYMDGIQLSTQQIPKDLKTILKLLKSVPPRTIQALLPIALDTIEQIPKNIAKSANIMIKEYDSLTLLLQEVIAAMADTHAVNNSVLMNMNILVNATKELSKMQQQWSEIIRYQNILTTRVETIRETVLNELMDTIKNVTSTNSELSAAARTFFVSKMLDKIIEIEQDAHLLYIMAKTYNDISNAYIVFQIANVSKLLVLPTEDERQTAMSQLGETLLFTLAEISQIVLEQKQQYQQRNQEIQEEYKQFIQQMMFEELAAGIGK
ncbi:unnamed protein product [Adineta steineri]|uniref:Secreted protein n=1 Tax=Adineta steineri TaxID=433720 RepID=A0A814QXU5_9BILA|nr:unnamed protein product [Adineta steineri]CAF1528299.1 unnamed protein product [Adineta steineri]